MKIVHESLIRLLNYIPFQDEVLKNLGCLELTSIKLTQWQALAKRFPNVIGNENMPSFIKEIDRLNRGKNEINSLLAIHNGKILNVWNDLRLQKKYEIVADFAFSLLNLPVSSISVERAFKAMKSIKTPKRNRLLSDNLEALLLCKYN